MSDRYMCFQLVYTGEKIKADRAESDMAQRGEICARYASGGTFCITDVIRKDARAGDAPGWMVPELLAKAMKERHVDYHMEKGVSIEVEIKPIIMLPGGKWHAAPTPETIHDPVYKPFIDAESPASEPENHQDEEEEEEEDEEEYEGIICPHCGATDDDTTFHALMRVTQTQTRRVHESREVRAWVEVEFVDEEGNVRTSGYVEDVHTEDEWDDYEEYDADIEDQENEFNGSEGVLVCTSCNTEFDAPGDVD